MKIGKGNQKTKAVSKASDKMPFSAVADEYLLKVKNNLYTTIYRIDTVAIQDTAMYQFRLGKIFASIPDDCVCQFVTHNEIIDREDYLKSIVVPGNTEEAKLYNKTLIDIADVGHNNTKKVVYFVVGKAAESVEVAKKWFAEKLPMIETAFTDIAITRLSTFEYLEVLFKIMNPHRSDYRKVLDLKDNGNPTLDNLKFLKMSERDLVSPKNWNTSSKNIDYTILDEKTDTECYTRSYFVNVIPKELSDNFVRDLSSVSSNMLFSLYLHPVSAQYLFDTETKRVGANTIVFQKAKRDTLEDKKNKTKITVKKRKDTTESAYFDEAALEVAKDTVAAQEQMAEVSILITLFADNLELLNRYDEMVKSSASKFGCMIKVLDLMQYEAFCSALPLCNCKVDVDRFLTTKRLTTICPVNVAAFMKQKGAFIGLNSLNDNLVIYDRKRSVNPIGMICGTEKSGKTYQLKREILNTLLTTKTDKVSVITTNDELDAFVSALQGVIAKLDNINPFYMTDGYGLTEDKNEAKRQFIAAFCGSEKEAEAFMAEDINFEDFDEILRFFDNDANEKKYPKIFDAITNIDEYLPGPIEVDKRLYLYKVKSPEDMLLVMDYLWNQSIEDKKKSLTNWIYVDKIDELLTRQDTLDYLIGYQDKTKALHNPVLYSIQDPVRFISSKNEDHIYNLEMLIKNCGYVKLLNSTPKEREAYAEWLKIPKSLIPYISNVGVSEGLIITPVSNTAFTDHFLDKDNEFTQLFLK